MALPCVGCWSQTLTDETGRFKFDHLIEGKANLMRNVDTIHRMPVVLKQDIEIKSGDHIDVSIVGQGRILIGKVLPPAGFNPDFLSTYGVGGVLLSPAISTIQYPEGFDKLSEEKKMDWFQDFIKSPHGRELLSKSDTGIRVFVFPDGAFRAESIPPGKYILRFMVGEKSGSSCGPGGCKMPKFLAHARKEIAVPDARQDQLDIPIDLRDVQLTSGGSFFPL